MNSEGSFRAFYAVALPDGLREALAGVAAGFPPLDRGIRWVSPANLHVTVLFRGDVPAGSAADLAAALDRAAAAVPSFDCTVAGVGSFGRRRSPRVVWAGIRDGAKALTSLHWGLLQELGTLAPRGGKPYAPHITLARVKTPRLPADWLAALAGAKDTSFGMFRVTSAILVRSDLSPEGARYTTLHEAHLGE